MNDLIHNQISYISVTGLEGKEPRKKKGRRERGPQENNKFRIEE